MGARKIKLLLDTNILVSAVISKGNPWKILTGILSEEYIGVTSPQLLAEFSDIFHKKFPLNIPEYEYIEEQIKTDFETVNPEIPLDIVRDSSDNKVLEAAISGSCNFIVTGDKDLLILKKYKKIRILNPTDFLIEMYSKS